MLLGQLGMMAGSSFTNQEETRSQKRHPFPIHDEMVTAVAALAALEGIRKDPVRIMPLPIWAHDITRLASHRHICLRCDRN